MVEQIATLNNTGVTTESARNGLTPSLDCIITTCPLCVSVASGAATFEWCCSPKRSNMAVSRKAFSVSSCLKCLMKTGPNWLCSANHPQSICVPRNSVGKSSIAVREACHAGGNPIGYVAAFSSFTLEDATVTETEDATVAAAEGVAVAKAEDSAVAAAEDVAVGETEDRELAGAEDAFSSFSDFARDNFPPEDSVVDAAVGETEDCESALVFGAFTLIGSSSAAFTLAAAFCAAAASSSACLTAFAFTNWVPESSVNVPDASRSFSLVSKSNISGAVQQQRGNSRWRCHHRSRRCPCFCRKLESQRGRINGGWESHCLGQQRGSV